MRRHAVRLLLSWLLLLAPVGALAQAPQPAPAGGNQISRLWIVAGGASATLRGDCQECEEDYPYRSSGALVGNAGYRVTPRMDVGVELFWMPVDTEFGNVRSTHVDAIAQFRPWGGQGFFVKGGAGMAFVRNWVDVLGPDAQNQKALSVVIGGGWEFWRDRRVGFQFFALQHAAALGDFETGEETLENVKQRT